ncbi:MAG: RNA polymerase sigma-70 factor [Cytophagales bacterium]|nr:RNA polymerase sigma-70 factor [Cytophagales bacterium]
MNDLNHLTNEELISRIFKLNDEYAYSILFKRIYGRLLRFAFFYVKSHQTAEDIVSEVFVNFLKGKESKELIRNVEAFFYKAIRNQSLKYIRKRSSTPIISTDKDDYEVISYQRPDQELINKELYRIITKVVNSLPMQRRIIFEMVKYDQLKYKEVAKILAISQKTVEKHMSISLKIIRKSVQDYLESKDTRVKKIHKAS